MTLAYKHRQASNSFRPLPVPQTFSGVPYYLENTFVLDKNNVVLFGPEIEKLSIETYRIMSIDMRRHLFLMFY